MRKNGRLIATRRKHDATFVIDNSEGITSIRFGIEILEAFRQVKLPTAGTFRQMMGEPISLLAHRLAMQAVGFRDQQKIQQQRHENRGAADDDEVQPKNAGNDRVESQHATFASAIM
jgi:hypothetical protein